MITKTEAWFRNPYGYIRELVECGESWIAWDRGYAVKYAVDPIKHAELYFGTAYPWRVLMIGPQGTAEYREGDKENKPTAVYPTWQYGEDADILIDYIENPLGENRELCADDTIPPDERPVWGQEHRVVVIDMPRSNQGPGRQFLAWLKTLQEDHPECIIHVHGSYSYKVAWGMGFGSADWEPRTVASKGKVTLPSGSIVLYERAKQHPQWITSLGFRPHDLEVPRNRCMYNIKSAKWASTNYREMVNFAFRGSKKKVDITSPDRDYSPPTTLSPLIGDVKPKPGDKQLCDTCSLQTKCKVYRYGAVCSLPDAEPSKLAKQFATRDADQIIDGLGTLMALGSNRLEAGVAWESTLEELDPHVTKMAKQLFDQGVTLAKLLNPQLRGGVRVNVGVGAGGAAAIQVNNGSANEIIAGIIRQLEQNGIERSKITEDMVEGVLRAMTNGAGQQQAIEGTVVASRTQT